MYISRQGASYLLGYILVALLPSGNVFHSLDCLSVQGLATAYQSQCQLNPFHVYLSRLNLTRLLTFPLPMKWIFLHIYH